MSEDKNIYYVYVHRRLSDNSIFYVGKGCNNRVSEIWGRSPYWWEIVIEEKGFIPCIIEKNLDEATALLKEVSLIKELEDLNLVNIVGNKSIKPNYGLNIPEVVEENRITEIQVTYSESTHLPKLITRKDANKMKKRRELFNNNLEMSNQELIALIQEQEPKTKKRTIAQWVSNKKNGR